MGTTSKTNNSRISLCRVVWTQLVLFALFLAPIFCKHSSEFELSTGLRLASASAETNHGANGSWPKPMPPMINCFARCVAACAEESDSEELKQCESNCHKYSQEELCRDHNHHHHVIPECWPKCRDLGYPSQDDLHVLKHQMTSPKNFSASYNSDFKIDAKWEAIKDAIYFVEIESDNVGYDLHLATRHNTFMNLTMSPDKYICGPMELKLSAANKAGITPPSRFALEKPKPLMSAKLTSISMILEKEPYVFEDYKGNRTIVITLHYEVKKWPFGNGDLEVRPIFHMVSCEVGNLEVAVPEPEFKPGSNLSVVANVSSDLMNQRCRFVYAIGEVYSKKCDTSYQLSVSNSDYSSVIIDCETVKNSNCQKPKPSSPPICSSVKDFKYDVDGDIDWDDPEASISVWVKFESTSRQKPIYFVSLYGHATHFAEKEKSALLGVNMTDIVGRATNCEQIGEDGMCKRFIRENAVFLENLKPNTLYGATICAIFDPENVSLPEIGPQQKFFANELYITPSEESAQTSPGVALIATIITIFVLILAVMAIIFWVRTQKRAERKKRINLEALRRNRPNDRYVDLPKRTDSWELERRNLIIYDDKKLGAGAFGAVFLGKMIGMPKGGKLNGGGPLNINLLRLNSENSFVAVKMLPEYADDLSKSEFLREIALMKTLGYHERLVNMLACVTNSEPYCLVVEMCSDGDLLHFLRERCKYMLDLNEAKIDYANPACDADFDRDMIMSLKQLLVFMVQISYGLEYLTQKGFVHRDVAARNILVHDKRYAKIGDFGLCRFIYAENCNYKSRGGRLPVKWMSPEAIRFYEFTSNSDVWSFGVLVFEIITLGGTPYPGIQPDDMLTFLEAGGRINQPDNCPDELYKIMSSCWQFDPRRRHEFSSIRQQLALQLEELTDEYNYLKLDAQKDYYNVSYRERAEQEKGEGAESKS